MVSSALKSLLVADLRLAWELTLVSWSASLVDIRLSDHVIGIMFEPVLYYLGLAVTAID